MGRTLETATDRADRSRQAVVDRDLGRVVEVKDAPSGAAMVRLLSVLGHAGPSVIDGKLDITVSDIELSPSNGTLKHWQKYCEEWTRCRVVVDDKEKKVWEIGSLVSTAKVDYSKAGFLTLTIKMSEVYKEAFEKSDIWALIDVEQCAQLKSKYATYLYLTLAANWNLKHISEISLDMDELRKILKIPNRKLKDKTHVFNRALGPATEEITRVTSFNITWEPIKTRRFITGARIRWQRKQANLSKSAQSSAETDKTPLDTPYNADWPKITVEQFILLKIHPSQYDAWRKDFCDWIRTNGHPIEPTANAVNLRDFFAERGIG